MTSLAKQARKSIKRMALHHRDGDWVGETPTELLSRWRNCPTAEIDTDGGLWISRDDAGQWLDDDDAIEFVAWLKSEGVTIDDADDATDGPDAEGGGQ